MQTLYPIVRRVRRPLVETNADMPKTEMLKVERVEPVQAVAAVLPHPGPLPLGEGTASDALRIVGKPSGETSPVIVEGKKSDEKIPQKSNQP